MHFGHYDVEVYYKSRTLRETGHLSSWTGEIFDAVEGVQTPVIQMKWLFSPGQ